MVRLGAFGAHLLAECSITFEDEVPDTIPMRAVGCEVAGRIALGPGGRVSQFHVCLMGLRSSIDTDHGLPGLLGGQVGLRLQSLTDIVVIRSPNRITKKTISAK